MNRLFTSESVTEGHPDKGCDQISDAVLDAILAQDKDARVACETCASTDLVLVMGEITTTASVDVEDIVRKTVLKIGYDGSDGGFNGNTCKIITSINKQSPDIALGVDNSAEIKGASSDELDRNGAGDQGMMFGYACDETEEYMPLAITLSHKLAERLADVRRNGLSYLRPDGKTQVTVEYDGKGKPVRVHTVVISSQHRASVDMETLKKDIYEQVIKPVIPENLLDGDTKILINPTGRSVTGGPDGDSGLTGRKIIVDTYGGYAPHGGGAFSGKDPTKVDRSAAYMARYVCKNVVAAGLAKKVEIELAYAIGVARPVSVAVNTFGTGVFSDDELGEIITKEFDLRPSAIIATLGLRDPVYGKTASYGHFGRQGFSWENTDRAEALKKYLKK